MDNDVTRLAADLRAAGEKAARGAEIVVQKSAFDAVNHAQRVIFQADRIDTGAMFNSVGVDLSGRGRTSRAIVGPTVDYAPHNEWGTSKGMKGIHFMGRAADAVEPGFVEGMSRVGIDAIQGG